MTPECAYCHDLREIVRIDGTPEVCPVCREWPPEPPEAMGGYEQNERIPEPPWHAR